MENASKALIMAAEILIGVMIISIGVYLFTTLGSYSAETADQIDETQIAQFNSQFLKFYGTSGGTNTTTGETIRCTIHDIVGLANLASQANEANGFIDEQEASDSLYYVQIDLKINGSTIRHLETKSQDYLITLVKENDVVVTNSSGTTTATTKYFKCTEIRYAEYTRKS